MKQLDLTSDLSQLPKFLSNNYKKIHHIPMNRHGRIGRMTEKEITNWFLDKIYTKIFNDVIYKEPNITKETLEELCKRVGEATYQPKVLIMTKNEYKWWKSQGYVFEEPKYESPLDSIRMLCDAEILNSICEITIDKVE